MVYQTEQAYTFTLYGDADVYKLTQKLSNI